VGSCRLRLGGETPSLHVGAPSPSRPDAPRQEQGARALRAPGRFVVKVIVLLVVGLYGWSVAGTWMRTHVDAVQNTVLSSFSMLRDLHTLELQQQRDYIGWLEGRVPEEVVRADDARIAEYRNRLMVATR
jgi:hypothetical protein